MPTKSASLILDLAPGKYLLFCNVAGHYMAGMWATVEVKQPCALATIPKEIRS